MILRLPRFLVAVVFATLADATALFSLNGSSYPIVSLSIYSQRTSLTAKEPVFFDLSGSTVDDPAAPVYILYQFGDTDETRDLPAWTVERAPSLLERLSQPPMSFVYNSPGTYVANVTISDSPFVVNSSVPHPPPWAITKLGYPASMASVQFAVLPHKSCYHYAISMDWNPSSSVFAGAMEPYGGGNAIAHLTVVGPRTSSANLTRTFVTMGDIPSLVMRNTTSTYAVTASVNKDMSGWTVVIPAAILNGQSGVTATVSSAGMSVLSCSIGNTIIDISIPYLNAMTLGFNMSEQLNGEYPGKAFVEFQYRPLNLRYSKDSCFPHQSLIVLGSILDPITASRNYLGGQVVVTTTGFEDGYQLRDLLRGPDGTRSSQYSLCYSLSDKQCKEMLVMDAALVDQRIYFLTSSGVFYTENFNVTLAHPRPTKFIRVVTGVAELDSATADYLSLGVRMYVNWDCSHTNPRYIYLLYSSVAGEHRSNLVVSSTDDIVHDAWASPVRLPTLLGYDGGYCMVHALKLSERNVVVYLIGKLSGLSPSPCSADNCLYENAVVLHQMGTLDNSAKNVSIGIEFPTDAVLNSLFYNPYDLSLYAYGHGAWASVDGGNHFRHLFTLENGETVTSVVAHPQADGVAFMTNLGSVYYTRSVARDTAKVRTFVMRAAASSAASGPAQMVALTQGLYEEYWRLQFDHPDGYPTNSSLYPRGFLKGPSGMLRDASDPFLRRLGVPIQSAIPATDMSFPGTLVPFIMGYNRVRFYVHEPAGGQVFDNQHVGNVVRSRRGGAAKIMSLNNAGTIADCLIIDNLVPESTSDSAAVGLTLFAPNFTMARMIVARMDPNATPALRPVRLELEPVAPETRGWLPTDVGKTVVVMKGSIVIITVLNATVAIGSVVFEPVGALFAPAAPGKWQLYDFRSAYQEVKSANQSLSVVSSGTNAYLVTLATGEVLFDEYFVGSVLKTGSAWAIVSRMISPSSLQVNSFDLDTAGTYSFENWSFSRMSPEHVYGTIPDTSTQLRSWTLNYDACSWTDLETSAHTLTDFAAHDAPYQLNVSVQVVGSKNLITSEYLAADSMLGMLGYYRSSGKFYTLDADVDYEVNKFKLSAYVASSVDDPAGKAILSIRPAETSLMCDTPAPVLTIIQACPPTKSLHARLAYDDATLLAGDGTLTKLIPTNYRPPSSRGKAVPLTKNVYNADPSKPRYRDVYSLSKATGSYKQCAGKADRVACGCTDAQRLSPFVADSDCMDRVVTVKYERHFAPKIYVADVGEPDTDVMIAYHLVEVNNRTDYCFDYMTECDADTLETGILDPNRGDELRWLGEELYHFRVDVAFGAFCHLSTEFKVWVEGAPSRTEQDQAVMAIAAVGFCGMLFTVYLVHSYRHSN